MNQNYLKTSLTPYVILKARNAKRNLKLGLCLLLMVATSWSIKATETPKVQPWQAKGLKQEVESKRTRNSKHFDIGNNKTTSFMSVGSIHFKNANNTWEEINNQIITNTQANSNLYPLASEKNAIKTYFPSNPFNGNVLMVSKEASFKEKINAIKFLDASKNVISTLPISNQVSYSVSDSKVSYIGFYPGLNLSYALGNDSRKFDLEITSTSFLNVIPANAVYLSIEETFSVDKAASIRQENGQQVVFVNGEQIIGFENPFAFDANTQADTRIDADFSFTKTTNGFLLHTDFSIAWIKNSSRVFPLHLDPTVNYFPQNVTMWTGNQTSSAGKASGFLRLTLATTASWAKFDISGIPAGAFVQSANYWGYHYTTLGLKIANIRGLGAVDPVPAAALALFNQSTTGGNLYNNNYTFAGTAFNWYMGALGGTASTDIAAAITNGWFGLGFGYVSGSTTFAYQYGFNASPATFRPYLEVTYFTTPCAGAPDPNSITAPIFSICPSINPGILSLVNTYTVSGIQYQWESSSSGITGLFTPISNATLSTLNTGTLGASTAYRAIITCTNGGPLSTTSTPIQIVVGPPAVSNAVAAIPLICPNGTGSLSLGTNYTGLGVGYQWQSSNFSMVGPYTNVTSGTTAATSGTAATFVDPNLNVNMYYQAILSCTAAPSLSSTSLPVAVMIAGTTTNTVPYHEGFEGVNVTNLLPNCSWAASNPTVICQTYTAANTLNRIPNNGSKYASFQFGTNLNGDYFYSNGIYLEPGITYSGSVWYTTSGNIGWTELQLLVGTTQAVTSLTNVASVNSNIIANTNYLKLSNTFTVGTAGLYYMALKARSTGSGTGYLTFDDLSVTAPCSINAPAVTISGNTVVCQGQTALYTACCADTYLWSNGATTSTANISSGNISVIATNTTSGCSSTTNFFVNTYPSPPVSVSAANNASFVCKGSSLTLNANGAGQGGLYTWSSGTTGISTIVSPTANTSYTVNGTNANGCSASAVILVAVKNVPTISSIASSNQICLGETATLTATGANSYTWSSNNNYLVGTQIVISPFSSINYTVTGLDASGCSAKSTASVGVSECTGLSSSNLNPSNISLFPNPNNGSFSIEFNQEGAKTVEIVDMTGKTITVIQTKENKTTLNTSGLSSGIYFAKIKTNTGITTLKYTVQN